MRKRQVYIKPKKEKYEPPMAKSQKNKIIARRTEFDPTMFFAENECKV